MNVLVTGSAGYIGSVLCPYLVAAGHDVVGLDTGYYDGCDFGPHDGEGRRSTSMSATFGPSTSSGSMRSSTWPHSRTTRSAT